MQFARIDPIEELNDLVECYWIAENDDPTPIEQKVVPDGFPEAIFHFGDPYMIKLRDEWETQPRNLLAGQITRYFYLKNSGRSSMMGIKFKPAGLTKLFGVSMHNFTDQVVELSAGLHGKLDGLSKLLRSATDSQRRIEIIQNFLIEIYIPDLFEGPIDKAVDTIMSTQGTVSIANVCEAAEVSERQLERLFKKFIGLSPKFFTRVIRFSNVFQLVQNKKMSWSELGLESGFYDQSHFIKNFKAFTGDDPSKYFFEEPTVANFFLKK